MDYPSFKENFLEQFGVTNAKKVSSEKTAEFKKVLYAQLERVFADNGSWFKRDKQTLAFKRDHKGKLERLPNQWEGIVNEFTMGREPWGYKSHRNLVTNWQSGKGDTNIAICAYHWLHTFDMAEVDHFNRLKLKELAEKVDREVFGMPYEQFLNKKEQEKDYLPYQANTVEETVPTIIDVTEASSDSIIEEVFYKDSRLKTISVISLITALTLFLVYLVYEKHTEANTDYQLRLITEAEKLIDEQKYRLAALLSLEAVSKNTFLSPTDDGVMERAANVLQQVDGQYLVAKEIVSENEIQYFASSSDAKYLTLVSPQWEVSVWDVEKNTQLFSVQSTLTEVDIVKFSEDNSKLILVSDGGGVEVLDAITSAPFVSAKGEYVNADLSEDNTILIAEFADGSVSISKLKDTAPQLEKELIELKYWRDTTYEHEKGSNDFWLTTNEELLKVNVGNSRYAFEEHPKGEFEQIYLDNEGHHFLGVNANGEVKTGLLEDIEAYEELHTLELQIINLSKEKRRKFVGGNSERMIIPVREVLNVYFNELSGHVILNAYDPMSVHAEKPVEVFHYKTGLRAGQKFQKHSDNEQMSVSLSHDNTQQLEVSWDELVYLRPEFKIKAVYDFPVHVSQYVDISPRQTLRKPYDFTNYEFGFFVLQPRAKFAGLTNTIMHAGKDYVQFIKKTAPHSNVSRLKTHTSTNNFFKFSDDSSLVLSKLSGDQIVSWNISTGLVQSIINTNPYLEQEFAVSFDKSRILTRANDGILRLRDFDSNLVATANTPVFCNNTNKRALVLDQDNNFISACVSGWHNQHQISMQVAKGKLNNEPELPTTYTIALDSFEPKSALEFDNQLDNLITEVPNIFRFLPQDLTQSDRSDWARLYSEDARFYASLDKGIGWSDISQTFSLKIVDTFLNKTIRVIKSSIDGFPMHFSSDNQYLIVSRNTEADIWNIEMGKVVFTFPLPELPNSIAYFWGSEISYKQTAISPDNRYVIAYSKHQLKVWNIQTKELVLEHNGLIDAPKFSPDGNYLAWIDQDDISYSVYPEGRLRLVPLLWPDGQSPTGPERNEMLVEYYKNIEIHKLAENEQLRYQIH